PFLLAIPLAFCAASSAHAGSITVNATTTVTFVRPGHETRFALGDKFDFSFAYNDAITDTNAATNSGRFNAAITSVSLTRYATNAGSWNPASGTFTTPTFLNTGTTGNGGIGFGLNGTGFPASGSNAFNGLIVSLKASIAPPLITDTGLGQTLAAQFGGALPGD